MRTIHVTASARKPEPDGRGSSVSAGPHRSSRLYGLTAQKWVTRPGKGSAAFVLPDQPGRTSGRCRDSGVHSRAGGRLPDLQRDGYVSNVTGMFSNRPLPPARVDLFVGRDRELAWLLEGIEDETNSLITGPPGSGKTSLLMQVQHELAARRSHKTLLVPGGLAADAVGLVELVADRAVGPRTTYESPPLFRNIDPLAGTPVEQPTPGGRLLEAIDRLRVGLSDRDVWSPPGDQHGPYWEPGSSLVVLLDDAPASSLAKLFGQARDAVWALPVLWVVTCRNGAAALEHGADLFFEQTLELSPLDQSQALALLRARLPDTAAVSDDLLLNVVEATDRTPRGLVTAARVALGPQPGRPPEAALDALQRRSNAQARAAALGRGAAMLVSVLQSQGGAASASDPALLAALGWTRARAAQVLRQLEESGLATASDRQADGAGRPRRVYRLIEELR